MKKTNYQLPESIQLNLNYYEFGSLMGVLHSKQKDLPESLQLKLNYWFTNAYKDHPALGEQARKDMKGYKKALRKLKK